VSLSLFVLGSPVQVPVHVYNTKLVRVYMRDLADEGLICPSSNVLDLSSSQFFERTLQTIKDEVLFPACQSEFLAVVMTV
jgi:hypothetical protein